MLLLKHEVHIHDSLSREGDEDRPGNRNKANQQINPTISTMKNETNVGELKSSPGMGKQICSTKYESFLCLQIGPTSNRNMLLTIL
jgi:hypothetical protein